jgi:asparagine synthase (glutamine-hydrolysing)
MDSSAIVCMADTLVSRGAAEPVATVSYYDDAEPNWNERPYFSAVEEKRGRTGYHIDTGAEGNFEFEFNEDAFAATPSSVVRPSPAARKFKQYLVSSGSRIVLSGIGGDETMGGVPTLLPEICDLLVRGQFISFFRKELQFALRDRAPVIKVLAKTCSFFLPSWANTRVKGGSPLPWLNPSFVHRYRAALHGYESRLTVFGPLPSIQENLRAFAALQRQLGCSPLSSDPPCEKRYPYLDRDLVEFVCAIPREQLVRLNQRRSLMRRALRGIVPDIILDRKRKAYVSRGPLVGLSRNFERLSSLASTMVAGTLGIVDPERLWQAVKKAQDCKDVPIIPVMRTLMVEFWLRSLSRQGLKNAGDSLHIGIHRPPVGPRWELQVGRTDFS